LTRCAAMRASKNSWHKILQHPARSQVTGSHLYLLETDKAPRQFQHEDAGLSAIFFCNAAQSFGKKRETVCVSGLPGTKTTNPKQKGRIKL
jgi:hypothetical protein